MPRVYHCYDWPKGIKPTSTGEATLKIPSISNKWTHITDFENKTFRSLKDDIVALRAKGKLKKIVDASAVRIGKSFSGLEISSIKIGRDPSHRVLIVGTHHAREWIAAEVAFLLAEYLIDKYSDTPTTDEEKRINHLINNREIWIVPIGNPDGHMYTIQFDRWWRTNRRKIKLKKKYSYTRYWRMVGGLRMDIAPALGSGIQIETVNVPKKTYCGVDLNRNFPTKNWGNETADNGDMKTSKNPEDTEIYCGPDGGSEPETKAIVDFIKKNPVQGVLTLHSFGHQVLFPDAAVGDTFLQQIGNGMVSLMNSRGSSYKFDKGSGLYPTTGDMMDYSYEKGAFLSYTFELSPEGNAPIDQFFSGLPEAEIESTFKQNLPALLSLINCAGQASKKMATGGATVTPSSSPSTTVVQVVGDCWKAFDKWP